MSNGRESTSVTINAVLRTEAKKHRFCISTLIDEKILEELRNVDPEKYSIFPFEFNKGSIEKEIETLDAEIINKKKEIEKLEELEKTKQIKQEENLQTELTLDEEIIKSKTQHIAGQLRGWERKDNRVKVDPNTDKAKETFCNQLNEKLTNKLTNKEFTSQVYDPAKELKERQ